MSSKRRDTTPSRGQPHTPVSTLAGDPVDPTTPDGTPDTPPDTAPDASLRTTPDIDATRRLNARSLALSALLGTHPPALPARALVALAELFGIAGGTMRTALSRMAAAGEVEADDGWYRLAGRFLGRQHAQDIGRRPATTEWDGRWHTVIAAADQRELADRRQFRSVLTDHRFGELRPDTWLRPANLAAPDLAGTAYVLTGRLDASDDGEALAHRLWDLDAIATTAQRLVDRVERLRHGTDLHAHDSIPDTFVLAAGVLRFLRAEPLLPPVLTPDPWPVDALRRHYAELETDLQRALRDFLRSQRDGTPAENSSRPDAPVLPSGPDEA